MSLTAEQIKDIDHMNSTMEWHYYPYLPILRSKDNKMEYGACYDAPNGKRTVFLGNLFALISGEIKLASLEKIEYNSSYDVVLDGWYVD